MEELPYSKELAEQLDSAKFLQELLGKMGVNGTVSAFENEEGIKLKIDSDTDGLLIGRRGETLDALQYIVSLYENKDRKENGYRRISIDTEGYRARREDNLKRLARRNALKVAKSGRSFAMEPMKKVLSLYPSGRVEKLQLNEDTVTGRTARKIFGLDSAMFTVEVTKDEVIFHTKGFGHGVGMSQAGANGMATDGADYRTILLHYYTGVTIGVIGQY